MLRATSGLPNLIAALHRWGYQDGSQFMAIAQQRYRDDLWRAAFFPLLPLLEHVVAPVVANDYLLAGLVIVNVAFFGTLVALRSLTEREFDAEAGRRACLYLAIYPTAFYLFAPFSESLFLFFAITTFAALRSRRWWLAGVFGCLATLTRSAGVLLLIPFAVELLPAIRAHHTCWWHALWALFIPLGVGLYSVYLYIISGDLLAFAHAQSVWNRTLQPPWVTFVLDFSWLLRPEGSHGISLMHEVLNLASLAVFVVLTLLTFRKLPLSYSLFSLTVLAYITLLPVKDASLSAGGDGRYVLMMFPVFMALGIWGKRPKLHEVLLVGMTALLIVACAHFLLGLAVG